MKKATVKEQAYSVLFRARALAFALPLIAFVWWAILRYERKPPLDRASAPEMFGISISFSGNSPTNRLKIITDSLRGAPNLIPPLRPVPGGRIKYLWLTGRCFSTIRAAPSGAMIGYWFGTATDSVPIVGRMPGDCAMGELQATIAVVGVGFVRGSASDSTRAYQRLPIAPIAN